MFKKVIFYFYIVICQFFLFSQENIRLFQRLTVNDGLGQNSVLDMKEDNLGYLWIGTQAGLSRWNGSTVINYPRENIDLFPAGYFNTIKSDLKGNIWFTAPDGRVFTTRDSGETFIDIEVDKELILGHITEIIPINEDELFLGTKEGGLFIWDIANKSIKRRLDLKDTEILSTLIYKKLLYLGTSNGWMVLNLDFMKIDVFPSVELLNYPIYQIYEFNGYIYGTMAENGLSIINISDKKIDNIFTKNVYWISKGLQNNIITISDDFIFSLFSTDSMEFNPISITPKIPINCINFLTTGQIAVGSRSSGVWFIDPYIPYFSSWTAEEDSLSGDIMSLVQDSSESLWIATYDGGIIYKNNNGSKTKYYNTKLKNSPSNLIKYIIIDQGNNIRAATYDNGVITYNKNLDIFEKTNLILNNNKPLGSNRINYIEPDGSNNLIISGSDGLYIYDIKSNKTVNINDDWNFKTGDKGFWATLRHTDNSLWVATDSGLLIEKNGVLKEVLSEFKQSWFLYETSNNNVIVGSPSGIELFDSLGNKIEQNGLYKKLTGLSIYGAIEDKDGRFWITSNEGLFLWETVNDVVENYTVDEGLLSQEFNLSSIGVLTSGELFFGGIKGINLLKSKDFELFTTPPVILFNHIDVGDKIYTRSIWDFKNPLILEPDDKYLSVGFDVINFSTENSINIEYLLSGFNNSWIDITNNRNINLVSLPHGHYTLNLKANRLGIYETEVKTLDIIVKPPFYLTKTFIIMIAFIVIIITLFITFYIFKLNKEISGRKKAEEAYKKLNNQLEIQVDVRTEELEAALENLQRTQDQIVQQQKMASLGQLVAGVAHEINTPLGISILSSSIITDIVKEIKSKILNNTLSKEEFDSYITDLGSASESMSFNLHRAATLVQDFKKVSVEKNITEKTTFNLKTTLISLLKTFQNEFKKKNILLEIYIDNNIELDSYPGDFYQVITNILMNAILHGFDLERAEENIIKVHSITEESYVILTISDNGSGINPGIIDKIFDPFFTTRRGSGGTGLGLNIAYNIVHEKLGGTISVQSSVGHGSSFILKLPLT